MSQTIELKIGADHIESLVRLRNPLVAIEELVWNGLDADATEITITPILNPLGALDEIVVEDNGIGIPYKDREAAFGSLGNSPKLRLPTTPNGRIPHGKSGKGRFRAYGIGNAITWYSRYLDENSKCQTFQIVGHRATLRSFRIGEPTPAMDQKPGVRVVVREIQKHSDPKLLECLSAAEYLAARLALYLKKYPGIKIKYGDREVDPQAHELRSETIPLVLRDSNGKEVDSEVTIIEWKSPIKKALYLCDESGFCYEERSPGIQAPGFNFTAYLKSPLVRDLHETGAFGIEGLVPDVRNVLDATKQLLKGYFRDREASRSSALVKKWQEQNIYPYDKTANDPITRAERQVFDVCAVKVFEYLPDFEKTDPKNKRLTFRLIKEALESNPSSLQTILRQVLELPQEQQDQLAALLERTKLSAVLNAARTVIDRLTFLGSLDHLLFGDYFYSSRRILLSSRGRIA